MSRYIPEDVIKEIQYKSDIYEIISGYVPLQKSGTRWKACCPFHNEKSPSFIVSPERQGYHCFGCGKSGNAFTFIMEKEGIDFPDAAQILASRYGVIIPEDNTSNTSKEESAKKLKMRKKLLGIHNKLSTLYNECLLTGNNAKTALNYLKNRHIDIQTIEKFGIGFAPDAWDNALKWARVNEVKEEEMIQAGLVIKKEETGKTYDRFRNRLIFPIWNEQGKVVAFSARTLEASPKNGAKYVNSPETEIFKKSKVLYALPLARKPMHENGFAILCEGQLDVIAMHRAGHENSIAPQGTAFTEDQARIIKRYTSEITICFDGDNAGIKASLRAIEILLPMDFTVKVIHLPEGTDPDNIFSKKGKEALDKYVKNPTDFFEFMYKLLSDKHDIKTPSGKAKIVNELIKTLSLIKNNIVKSSYASHLAKRLEIQEKEIIAALEKSDRKYTPGKKDEREIPAVTIAKKEPEKRVKEKVTNKTIIKKYKNAIIEAEKILLELILLHKELGRSIDEELPNEMISDTTIGKALNTAISMTLNDEWGETKKELEVLLCGQDDKDLAHVLTTSSKFGEEFNVEQAVKDCIKTIKLQQVNDKINSLLQEIKAIDDAKEKQDLLIKISELQRKKISYSGRRKR